MLGLLALNLKTNSVAERIGIVFSKVQNALPGEAAGGWGPGLKELAEKDDAAEVVGVVGGEGDELVLHGHDAGGSSGAGWTADGVVEVAGVLGGCGGLFGSLEEAPAEVLPWFFGWILGEAVGVVAGVGGFDAGDPVEGDLLPEGEVPELGVDGVGDVGEFAVDEVVG
jgi:hypothetical protein